MATKWCTKLEVALKRCLIVFQGHPSNFKVTRLKKWSNLTQIGRFRTVTPVWIHWCKWNDTQSLMLYRRDVLLFFGVIHQISRSHGWKINDLNPIWARLLGRSQLSNPSDLPCCCENSIKYIVWGHFKNFHRIFFSFSIEKWTNITMLEITDHQIF